MGADPDFLAQNNHNEDDPMAAPASYTEATLADYAVDQVLVAVATKLGWTSASAEVVNAIDETLLALNVSDLVDFITPVLVRKLRAFTRREIWRQAMQVTAHKINLSADGASVDLSTLHAQCKALYQIAATEVDVEYGGNVSGEDVPAVVLSSAACPCDPYVPTIEREQECET